MTLEDLIEDDATGIASQDFDETVTFYPDGVAASGTVISVLVVREEPGLREEGGRTHEATVLIPRAAITGTPTTDDELDVVLRIGEAAEHVRISHVEAGDPGFWQCEVRR